MGTSSSSKGSGGKQPLVPPGTDDQPGKPMPTAQPQRFKAFRTAFGKFLKGGDGTDLKRSLGHYARTSTGGSSPAVSAARSRSMPSAARNAPS